MFLFSSVLVWTSACDWKSGGEDSATEAQVSDDTALTSDSTVTGDTEYTGLPTDSATTTIDTSEPSDTHLTSDSADTAMNSETGDSGGADTGVDIVLSSEQYVMVSSGWYYTCGLKVDGVIECWGVAEGTPTGMSGEFSFIGNMAAGVLCGVTFDGLIGCQEDWDLTYATTTSRPEETLLSVDCGWAHCCAITTENELTCWGADDGGKHDYGQVTDTPTTGQYSQVAVGYYHSCALDLDGMATCWGDITLPPPEEPLKAISGGRYSSVCGLTLDGGVDCWSASYSGAEPRSGEYVSLGLGGEFACATDVDGFVTCWGGIEEAYKPSPVSAQFAQVSGGLSHVCGVRTDGYVQCWGFSAYGETTPP